MSTCLTPDESRTVDVHTSEGDIDEHLRMIDSELPSFSSHVWGGTTRVADCDRHLVVQSTINLAEKIRFVELSGSEKVSSALGTSAPLSKAR